eukprot:5679334-Pyramimonas_sp.AAC.1
MCDGKEGSGITLVEFSIIDISCIGRVGWRLVVGFHKCFTWRGGEHSLIASGLVRIFAAFDELGGSTIVRCEAHLGNCVPAYLE